jgi:hypothetical protein
MMIKTVNIVWQLNVKTQKFVMVVQFATNREI